MPDTSKMSPEAYAAHTGKMSFPTGYAGSTEAAKHAAEAVKDAFLPLKPLVEKELDKAQVSTEGYVPLGLDGGKIYKPKSQGESMSEPFKYGQKVWFEGIACEVRAIDTGTCWIWNIKGGGYFSAPFSTLTATDPNANPLPPEPQKCMFCGDPANVYEGRLFGGRFYAGCPSEKCDTTGPWKPNREEAIAAWNSISIDDPGWDATDSAHPAWWRGNESGVVATSAIATNAANGAKHSGVYGETVEAMVNQIEKLHALSRQSSSSLDGVTLKE